MSEQVFDTRKRWEIPFDELPERDRTPIASMPGFMNVLPPGMILGDLLGRIDRTELSGHDLVEVIKARQRQISFLQAQLFEDLTELGYCEPSGPGDEPERAVEFCEFTADEVSAALHWTRRAAESMVEYARAMVERFPRVGEALSHGLIDLPRAKVIVDAVSGLDPVTAEMVTVAVLQDATELTTGQLRYRLSRLCIDIDSDAAKVRYENALEERRVTGGESFDGTAYLAGDNLEAERVASIMNRLNREARRLRRQGDPRTMDQIKADLYLEWLEGNHTDNTAGSDRLVDIRVDLDTLIGLNDNSAEIPGWGPVMADIARKALEQAPDGTWRVAVTDPDTGAVQWDGTTRRRPTTAQRRHVEARQTECTFPTCRMPSHHSDIDHREGYAQGGPTKVDNLDPGCRHHHDGKTKGHWKVERTQRNQIIWISRHGHRYIKPP